MGVEDLENRVTLGTVVLTLYRARRNHTRAATSSKLINASRRGISAIPMFEEDSFHEG